MRTFSLLLLSLGLVRNGLGLPTEECPILGPVLHSGFDLAKFKVIQDAKSNFPATIESILSAGIINETHTSFAINVFSTATNESLYSYYHAAEALNDTLSTGKLDDGTVFRTGSVSKLFTAYALLANSGFDVVNRPVTDILPELAGNNRSEPTERIIWEDVTVGALLSHQAGSGGARRFPIVSIVLYQTNDAAALEISTCPNDTLPGCGFEGL
jgi:CubicO group peptidase (beta-lactamase class C family)